jgi:hypothetical protein
MSIETLGTALQIKVDAADDEQPTTLQVASAEGQPEQPRQ